MNDGLPYAPLELTDRTALPTREVPAQAVLDELPPGAAVAVFDVLRAVFLASSGNAATPYDPSALVAWERELLTGALDPLLRDPLAVIVGSLRERDEGGRARQATACLALADWALGLGARETALACFEAAALSWPENARYALVLGRALRNAGRLRAAERWLRRAIHLARWRKDRETHAFALSTLGMVYWSEGAPAVARKHLLRARRVAARHGDRLLEGEILHNLLAVAISTDDLSHVAEYALGALERYLPAHHRITALAYDVAYYWLTRGHAHRALSVLQQLSPYFREAAPRLQVLCATARAAGAVGDVAVFEAASAEASVLAAARPPAVVTPAALLDLGLGACHLERYPQAAELFQEALHLAETLGQTDMTSRAAEFLAAAADGRNPDRPMLPR